MSVQVPSRPYSPKGLRPYLVYPVHYLKPCHSRVPVSGVRAPWGQGEGLPGILHPCAPRRDT